MVTSAGKLESVSGFKFFFFFSNCKIFVLICPAVKRDKISNFKTVLNFNKLMGHFKLLRQSTSLLPQNTSVLV